MTSIYAYWKLRSMAHPVRLLLTYAGEKFEDKYYECGPAPDYDRSHWLKEKETLNLDFPNLPYYIDDKARLTQSSAIMRYLARKYDLEGKTLEEKTRADVLDYELQDLRSNFLKISYGDFDQLKDEYLKNLPIKIKQLSSFLGDRKFFAGENLTFVDFWAYEYLFQQLKLEPNAIDNFNNLKQFFDRFEALPHVSEYVKNAPASKYPLNGPMAKFGNV